VSKTKRTIGLAPYEKDVAKSHCRMPASPRHGGYGALVEPEFIVGPFMMVENALEQASKFPGSVVVRWRDQVRSAPTDETRFRQYLSALTKPLVVSIRTTVINTHGKRHTNA
jgi:hypothetical protein